MLERLFQPAAHGSSVGRELQAGCVTFAAMSYILFVQPALLATTGMEPGGVLFATCVASAAACFLMAWWGRHPFALAPAMGHNVFFAFTICAALGFTWQEALAANFLAGALFLALAPTGLRVHVMRSIPGPIRAGLSAGIGLLIALVGLEWAGVIVDHPVTLVALSDLRGPVCTLALVGLGLHAVLLVRRVPGAILIGVIATAFIGTWMEHPSAAGEALVSFEGVVGAPPAPAHAFALDFAGLFARPWTEWLTVIAVLWILDLFDTVGSLLALGRQAGSLDENGDLPRARGALAADAAGTTLGALLGTSTITSYVESGAGIAAGGRTGLTAVTTGVLMLAALVFTPLVSTLGAGVTVAAGEGSSAVFYPVVAPVLVLVGALMMGPLREVDWDELADAIPAFLTAFLIPLSFSITDGLAFGLLSYVGLRAAQGRWREVPWLAWVLAPVFLLRFLFLEA